MNTAKDTIADLIVDIRFSQIKINAGQDVESETIYRDRCKSNVSACFARRHNFTTNKWGWPTWLDD